MPNPVNISVREAFDSILKLMSDNLRGVDVQVDVSPASLQVCADPGLLDQLLLNIIKNATDAMSDVAEPALQLRGDMDRGKVVLRISDTGPGIAENAQDQVFIPFFTTKRNGNGIGLSLCRQIMTAHHGEIAINRSSGKTIVSLVF